ncbi:hypothetical protein [uncultured Tateyamaria sp.]|uniref:hypothetical protein n=1 Tax=uncultured Tateyamaria sp. TaxID=455651 RepID=UPI002635B5F1|nr:hypothetical protein [uncultured Tateyamaria sp.]
MKNAAIMTLFASALPLASLAQTSLESLYTTMRCDQALPMILTAMNDEQSFFSTTEAREVKSFLLGFGLLAKFEHPDSAKEAVGAAYGALVFHCENEPSRTIFELAERHFRN